MGDFRYGKLPIPVGKSDREYVAAHNYCVDKTLLIRDLLSGLLGPVEINITRTPCAGKAGGLHSGAQMDEAFLRLDVADGKDRYTEP